MTRRYDSSRRKKGAEQTRKRILNAAMKLHWEGITKFEPLAQEAGCSMPTLRKHFPTKEALFRGCTRAFAEKLTMPDLVALDSITEPPRRFEAAISELCRIHEAMFGYAWLGAHLREHSPVLDKEMRSYEELTDAVSQMIASDDRRHASVVRGLLDFLTYRAMRLSGQLAPSEAKDELIATLRPFVMGGASVNPWTRTRKDAKP